MNLNDFLEEYVDEIIKKKLRNTNKNDNDFKDKLIEYFDIALENFAGAICEKQRELCINELENFLKIHNNFISLNVKKYLINLVDMCYMPFIKDIKFNNYKNN